MTTTSPSLRWITPRTSPRAMAPVWAKKNINTLYDIQRELDVHTEDVTWSLRARRQGQSEWIDMGVFSKLKDAKLAANRDSGLA